MQYTATASSKFTSNFNVGVCIFRIFEYFIHTILIGLIHYHSPQQCPSAGALHLLTFCMPHWNIKSIKIYSPLASTMVPYYSILVNSKLALQRITFICKVTSSLKVTSRLGGYKPIFSRVDTSKEQTAIELRTTLIVLSLAVSLFFYPLFIY